MMIIKQLSVLLVVLSKQNSVKDGYWAIVIPMRTILSVKLKLKSGSLCPWCGVAIIYSTFSQHLCHEGPEMTYVSPNIRLISSLFPPNPNYFSYIII